MASYRQVKTSPFYETCTVKPPHLASCRQVKTPPFCETYTARPPLLASYRQVKITSFYEPHTTTSTHFWQVVGKLIIPKLVNTSCILVPYLGQMDELDFD